MLSKSVALFAAFAAFAPALAVPIPDVVSTGEILGIPLNYNSNKQSLKRDVADAIVYVKHVADDPIVNVASSSKRDDPSTDLTDIMNNALNSATYKKRDNLVTAVVDVKNVANDALVNIASAGTSKRQNYINTSTHNNDVSDADNDHTKTSYGSGDGGEGSDSKSSGMGSLVVVDALVKNVANNAHVNVASTKTSKRQNYINTDVHDNDVKDADGDHTTTTYGGGSDGKSSDSKSSGMGSLAVVDAYVNDVANNAHVNVASMKTSKRASVVGVVADVKNVANNAHVNVASTKTSKRGEVSSVAEVIVYLENILNYLKVNVLSSE